jgi:hypothetical protein
VKVARVQLWQQVDYKCVAPCFEQVFGYVWEHTGATMDRVQLSRLNEVSFDTKSIAGVFLHVFCNIWVLCEDTGTTTCRVQLWRLHEFRFYSNWSTELFFFMFSPRFGFSGNIQVSQWIDNNCEGFKSSSLAPKRITGLFLYVFHHVFLFTGKWQVWAVSSTLVNVSRVHTRK